MNTEKTIEKFGGKKFWVVDATMKCTGCVLEYHPLCKIASCLPQQREDKRDVIFHPYSEEVMEEKTFTLSQIIVVLESLITNDDDGLSLNIHWNSAIRSLQSKLEQL